MESKQAFGAYVKQKRTELGYSQRELAEKLFVTESAVSKWERGISYPDITQITPLCKVLHVSEHELVTASDDWRQRKLEQEAKTFKKARFIWLVTITILYVAIVVVSLSGMQVFSWQSLTVVLCCMWMACFTHVPILIKGNKGLVTLISSYSVINVLVFSVMMQQGQIGIDNMSVAVVGVLFSLSLVVVPALLKLASIKSRSPLFSHKALISLAIDSLLLLVLVWTVASRSDIHFANSLQVGGPIQATCVVLVLLIPVWTSFLSLRYVPLEKSLRLALAFACFGFWVFIANGLINVIVGLPFDFHMAVNFSDWITYPVANDNLCWVLLIVCLVIAGILCIREMCDKKRSA